MRTVSAHLAPQAPTDQINIDETFTARTEMKKEEFRIGLEFYTGSGKWRCTDIGTRVIVAIKLDQDDPRYYNGPPYSIVESAFDEYDMRGCSLDPADFADE